MEDHFALDNTTITDLEVSDKDKTIAAASPVKSKHRRASEGSKAKGDGSSSSSSHVPDQHPAPPKQEDKLHPVSEVHVGALVMRAPPRGYVTRYSSTDERVWTRGRRSSSAAGGHHRPSIPRMGEDDVPSLDHRHMSTSQVPSSTHRAPKSASSGGSHGGLGRHRSVS